MAAKAAEVIAAVVENKDIHLVMGEDPTLFGAYGDMFTTGVRDYYAKHKSLPTKELLEQMFPDVTLPNVSGATAYHLDQLKKEFVDNRMEQIMLAAIEHKDSMPTEKRLEKLQASLAKLSQYTATARDLSLNDLEAAEEYFDKMRMKSELNGGTPGISTGFDTIDSAYTTGWSPGHSITLMGYSGKGKSMLSGLFARNAWEQGNKVMVVSMEMTPEEYRERIYTMKGRGQFSMSRMQIGDIDPDDFRTWGTKSLKDLPEFIVTSNEGITSMTPNIIQGKIDMHKPDIVVLDYLQLMSDNAQTGDMTRRMMNLSREIKLLATSNNIPIISITAVTDEDNDKRDGPPVVSQISWSKAIEYDSNMIIAVHRHTDTNIVEIVCRKNRHGDLFSMYFEVDFDRGIWEEKFDL